MKILINGDKAKMIDVSPAESKYSGNINYYKIELEFDSEWDGLEKTALFIHENSHIADEVGIIDNYVYFSPMVYGKYKIAFKGKQVENEKIIKQISTNIVSDTIKLGAGDFESEQHDLPTSSEWDVYIKQIQDMCDEVTTDLSKKQDKLTSENAGSNITITEVDGTVKINGDFTKPYLSLERLASYLYKVTFDNIPEEKEVDTLITGCSSYVNNGKLYRNLDWNYDENNLFLLQCKGFKGMAFLNGLNDKNMDDDLIGQLPYHIADGVNEHGIMVSTHVLYNDWDWHGTGEKNISLYKIPYIILNEIDSLDNISTKLSNVLSNLKTTPALDKAEYLLQFIISDGITTYAILPPINNNDSYIIENITNNSKLTNFRWVNNPIVDRIDLQERPTGVERFNLMPTNLENLRFTKAYEEPIRLSEFIGINGTTKNSTDEELIEIYNVAHTMYENRKRDGKTWQTMYSIIYSPKGIEELYIQEDWERNYVLFGNYVEEAPIDGNQYGRKNGQWVEITGGGGGTSDHAQLRNLDYENSGHTGFQKEIEDLENIRTGANKGNTAVQDSLYVHTDNNYTDEEKSKLNELENYNDTQVWEAISEHDTQIQNIENDIDSIEETAEEAKNIARGRATGYVFNTKSDMDTALENEEFISKLNLGDNLYIRATDTPDYWWDGTQAQQLETQKVDLDEYVKNTDYATSSKGGVIKTSWARGTGMAENGTTLVPTLFTYGEYSSANDYSFIGKGTLENVITGKGLTNKIENVKIQGNTQQIENKTVNLDVPTMQDFENVINWNTVSHNTEDGSLTIVDAFDYKTKNNKIYGNYVQTTTTGKNLAKVTDCNIQEEKYSLLINKGNISLEVNKKDINFDLCGGIVAGVWSQNYEVCTDYNLTPKDNGVYTIKWWLDEIGGAGTFNNFLLLHTNQRSIPIYINPTETKKYVEQTITLNSNEHIKQIALWNNGANEKTIIKTRVQLEKSPIATDYEMYTGGKPSPSKDNPQEIQTVTEINYTVNEKTYEIDLQGNKLCALPTGEKDYLEIDEEGNLRIIKNIRELSLPVSGMNNNESYPGWLGESLLEQIYADFPNQNTFLQNQTNFFSNIQGTNVGFGINTAYKPNTQFFMISSYFNNLTQSQWKANYPNLVLDVYYKIKQPEIINLGKLEELIKTNKNTNIIELTSNINTTYEITYASINNITESIENAIKNKGLISNKDYATDSKSGVVKTASYNNIGQISGNLTCYSSTYDNYKTLSNNAFVAKGTLENVITGKGLIKDTDYASTTKGGTIKVWEQYGYTVGQEYGNLYPLTKTYDEYKNMTNFSFIGKGTLENVITGKQLISDAPSDDKQYARKNGQWEEVQGGEGGSGLVDDVKVDGVSVVSDKVANIDLLPIKNLIPTQASTNNQLADKNFVNSSISTATAEFKGTFTTLSELQAKDGNMNDYAFYDHVDSLGNKIFDRYKYVGLQDKRVPDSYTQYNSIINQNMTRYINTGIVLKSGYSIEAEIKNVGSIGGNYWARIAGVIDNSGHSLEMARNNGTRNLNMKYNGISSSPLVEMTDDYDTIVLSETFGKINDTVIQFQMPNIDDGYPLYLFRFNSKGTPSSNERSFAIKSFKIKNEIGEYVFDGVPCKNNIGQVGLYDVVTGSFFGDVNGGDFGFETISGDRWLYEYSLNNSSFTSEQWATINSGLTSESIENAIKNKGLISNTDYATSSKAGTFKINEYYGTYVSPNNGIMSSVTKSYNVYKDAENGIFVSKGTLENVIAGKNLVSDTNYITNSTDTSVTQQLEHNNEYRYTLDLTDITITLPETMPSDFISSIVFKSGGKSTSFNYPSQIKWSGNDINLNNFVPVADKTYNIIIWNDGININGVVRGV